MAAETTPTTSYTVDATFTSPPDVVFDMLTNQLTWNAFSGFFGTGLSAEVGTTNNLCGITCTVAESEAPHRLVWKDWRADFWPAGATSTVSWELRAADNGGTKVVLTHSDVPEDQSMAKGWFEHWFDPMQKYEELPTAKRQKLVGTHGKAVCHVDIYVRDLAKASEFYTAVFGWETVPFSDDYTFIDQTGSGTIGGGFARKSEEDMPPAGSRAGAIAIVTVPDIDATLEKVTAAGGSVKSEKKPLPYGKAYAEFLDHEGNYIIIFENDKDDEDAKTKCQIDYFEIQSTDSAEVSKWYGILFGWTFNEFAPWYTRIQTHGPSHTLANGGVVGKAPPEDNSKVNMLIYVEVADIDATLVRIQALGGAVVSPKCDLPGAHGDVAEFTDKFGNRLGLYAPSAAPCDEKEESKAGEEAVAPNSPSSAPCFLSEGDL